MSGVSVVRIVMQNCEVEEPPPSLDAMIREEYKGMETPMLLWLLSVMAQELGRRGVVTPPPSTS